MGKGFKTPSKPMHRLSVLSQGLITMMVCSPLVILRSFLVLFLLLGCGSGFLVVLWCSFVVGFPVSSSLSPL